MYRRPSFLDDLPLVEYRFVDRDNFGVGGASLQNLFLEPLEHHVVLPFEVRVFWASPAAANLDFLVLDFQSPIELMELGNCNSPLLGALPLLIEQRNALFQ